MKFNSNVSQDSAIKHGDGPCLVLAGPGSGKTYVLTNRILCLIKEKHINPANILVLTFTRAAANEMKQRFLKLSKENSLHLYDEPTFGTFHSVFFDILKTNFGYNSKSIIDAEVERDTLYKTVSKFKFNNISNSQIPQILSDIKNYKLCIEKNEKYVPQSLNTRRFNNIYKLYNQELYNQRKLDFSDMVYKCYELLKDNKAVLKQYQNKYKYILIDEFQDINNLQYELIKLICKNKNIFVVGDDDQSIYKFRGSHPKIIHDYLKDFKDSKVIYLNENYRCAKQIVNYSKYVINHNIDRFTKNLVPKRDEVGKIEIKSFNDSYDENKYIIDLINNYRMHGKKLSDIAILYRTNVLSNSIRSFLNKYNIHYTMKNDTNSFYNHFAIKDILSYLRLSINATSYGDLLTIINKPNRYISRNSFINKSLTIENLIKSNHDKEYVIKNLDKLKKDLKIVSRNLTSLAIRYIRKNIYYDKYLFEYCNKNDLSFDEIEESLDALEEEAILYKDIKSFLEYIDKLQNDKNINTNNNNIDSLNLSTFHLCKGLEFDTVIIIDSNDGLIPHKKSINDSDIESERRLFYVAMTRAKNNLHILFTTHRFGREYKPSRFIMEAIGGNDG